MWLSRNIRRRKSASVAETAASDNGIDTRVSAVSAQGKGQCEIVNPPGIISVPGKNNNLVIIPADGRQMCIGVRVPYYENNIEPGEVLIMSDGGASIRLANDGNVYINGREE